MRTEIERAHQVTRSFPRLTTHGAIFDAHCRCGATIVGATTAGMISSWVADHVPFSGPQGDAA